MKKYQLLVLFLSFTITIAACSLQVNDPEATSTSAPTVDSEIETLIAEQRSAEMIVVPAQPETGGFWYFDDRNFGAGFDPVYATCNGKALRLQQNGDGWNVEKVPFDQVDIRQLNPTGHRSDYLKYVYLPSIGKIYVLDDTGRNPKEVVDFEHEYNPEYWIWAWSSLMFIKDCHLRIFYIRPDGTYLNKRYDF